jgi:hypothetical protein
VIRLASAALVLLALPASAQWKFRVLVDGQPRPAHVSVFATRPPVGSDVPCLLHTTALPRGATVTSPRCTDAQSAAKLLALAKEFREAPPTLETDTDARGTGALRPTTAEFDVVVSGTSFEGRFRVRPVAGVVTDLEVRTLTEEQLKAIERLGQGGKSWLVAVDWPQVLRPDDERWETVELARGRWVQLSDDGTTRRFLDQLERGMGAWPPDPLSLTVTRNGKPVAGAEVVLASFDLTGRAKTDGSGGARLFGSAADTALVVAGSDCAIAKFVRGPIALAPCTLQTVQVVDEQGRAVPDALAKVEGDDSVVLGALEDGRLLVPPTAKELTVKAPGFMPERVKLDAKRRVTLTVPFETHRLEVRSAGGVRCPNPSVREPESAWFHLDGSLYETASVQPLVRLGCGDGPAVEVKLDKPVIDVTLPAELSWRFPSTDALIAPELDLSGETDYRAGSVVYRAFVRKPWPMVWRKRCDDAHRCRLEQMSADGTTKPDPTRNVKWSVRALRPDGGVSRGGSVEVRGGRVGEQHRASFDQLGVAHLETSAGWFWVSTGEREGQWCLAGAPCVLRETAPVRPATIAFRVSGAAEDEPVSGPFVRGGLENGVGEFEVPAGAHHFVVAETHLVDVSVDAGQRLEVPLTLPPARTLSFVVKGPHGPLANAEVELGAEFSSGWRAARTVKSDEAGRVRLEGFRGGNVPLLVWADGYSPGVFDGASIDGGVTLEPGRWVRLRGEAGRVDVTLDAPPGFPKELWGTHGWREMLGPDAGVELPAGPVEVFVSTSQWVYGRRTIAADATTLELQQPAGNARGVGALLGNDTRLDVVPGAPLTDEELATGRWVERPHYFCYTQPLDPACVTAPLPRGPATVILDPPERARGPRLMWRIDVPASGTVVLDPAPNAKPL